MAVRKNPSATPLTREGIVSTALALVDREGLPALSMRRLGAELGADPMAVYHYLPNKEALLDGIVEAVMSEIALDQDDPSLPFEERVLGAARAYRDVMLAHVNALPAVLTRGPSTPAALRPAELLVALLSEAGLEPAQAVAGMNAVAAAVRGIVAMATMKHPETLGSTAATPAGLVHPPDFFGADFDFGIRARAVGLLVVAEE